MWVLCVNKINLHIKSCQKFLYNVLIKKCTGYVFLYAYKRCNIAETKIIHIFVFVYQMQTERFRKIIEVKHLTTKYICAYFFL